MASRRKKLLALTSAALRRRVFGSLNRALADDPRPDVDSELALSGEWVPGGTRSAKKSAAPSTGRAGAAEGRMRRPGYEKVSRANPRVKRLRWKAIVMSRGVLKERQKVPGELDFSDLGNALRLASDYGQNLKYCEQWTKWLWWDTSKWVIGKGSKAMQAAATMALDTLEAAWEMLRKLPKKDDPSYEAEKMRVDEIVEKSRSLHSKHRLTSMVHLASQSSFIAVNQEDLDSDPWLLNTVSGVIDLRTGALSEPKREYLITKSTRSSYSFVPDGEPPCPKWLKFIDEVTCGDQDLADYLQMMTGYMLTGLVGERILFIFYGLGANGKGTFLRVLQEVLGDYAQPAPQGMLEESHSDDHPSRIASLYRARIAVCAEVERGKRLAEGLVKDLTGGDRLAARRMREDFWYFYPTHKIILQGNYKPVISGTDNGIWDRVHVIPWKARFSDKDQNRVRDLYAQLVEEGPGILAWAVRGCLAWQELGKLEPSASIVAATKKFKDEMDHVVEYVQERILLAPGDYVTRDDVREDYEIWAMGRQYPPLSAQEFTSRFRESVAKIGGTDTKRTVKQGPNYPIRVWGNVSLDTSVSPLVRKEALQALQ